MVRHNSQVLRLQAQLQQTTQKLHQVTHQRNILLENNHNCETTRLPTQVDQNAAALAQRELVRTTLLRRQQTNGMVASGKGVVPSLQLSPNLTTSPPAGSATTARRLRAQQALLRMRQIDLRDQLSHKQCNVGDGTQMPGEENVPIAEDSSCAMPLIVDTSVSTPRSMRSEKTKTVERLHFLTCQAAFTSMRLHFTKDMIQAVHRSHTLRSTVHILRTVKRIVVWRDLEYYWRCWSETVEGKLLLDIDNPALALSHQELLVEFAAFCKQVQMIILVQQWRESALQASVI